MSGPAPLPCLATACAGYGPIGIAVSGGGDSVAALVLAVESLGAARVEAVTVDHGLRPESAQEAQDVAALCRRLDVRHDVLHWEGPVVGSVQDAARRARHALISGWAKDRVDAVILAHTLDDQAETVLMRLARGSGVDGLSAMAIRHQIGGVTWLRPFLQTPRAALRAALQGRGIGWVEDPSNDDARFLRVRARAAVAALADLGLSAEGLARTAGRMQRARSALEAQTRAAIAAHVQEKSGVVGLGPGVMDLPPEIRDRVFAGLLKALSGAVYPPRLEALQRLIGTRGGTLMGCALRDMGDGGLLMFREAAAVAHLETPHDGVWDGRWRAEGPGDGDIVIRATGHEGLAQLSAQAARGVHPHWRDTGLPLAALAGLPALWRGADMIAAPLAFWPRGWHLRARPLAAMNECGSHSH